MSVNGKGSRSRVRNFDSYRDNYDSIFKKKKKPYPDWICQPCGMTYGKRPEGNPYGATWHYDKCGVCGNFTETTELRDYGHLREDWDK